MATAKKTTAKKKAPAKRAARKAARREKVRRLGRLIAAAIEDAANELPHANQAERRQWIVSVLNKKLDIGLLNEEQEELLLGLLVDAVADLVVTSDNRGNLRRGALAAFNRLKGQS